MGDGAGDFDTQQPGDAEQEAEDSCYKGTPNEHRKFPGCIVGDLAPDHRKLAAENDKGEEQYGRAHIGPPCQLDRGVIAIRQRALYQHRMNSDEERGKDTVDE